MKKFSSLILAFVALVGFNACSADDDVVFTAQPDPEGVSFTNTFSATYVLTSAASENTAERFVWNPVDVGAPTNVTYEVQGSTTQSFEDYTVIGSTSDTNLAVTVGQMMDIAEDAGLDNDPTTEDIPNTGTIFFRVVASAGTAGELAHISEPQALTVMLHEATEAEEELPTFFLVGSATPDNWNNSANNYPLFRDADDPAIFYYTGKFLKGEFKILETLGAWQPQWGLSSGSLTSSDILGEDPGAFAIPSEGYYSFTVNFEDMTYTLEPYDASSAPVYATIGFLGDATAGGWDADTDLTKSSFNPHIWYANDVALGDGEMKFRAADAWDVSWGTTSPLSGKATLGGPNIPVEEGVYDIWFNDLTGRYILVPQGE